MITLNTLDISAQQHCEKMTQHIRQEINRNGGSISFARFMELALYAPGLGYYNVGTQKLGREGDFVTAPEISPLFSQCVAEQCAQIISALSNSSILEFGAGTGKMAAEILVTLQNLNHLPEKYYILEVSADLRQRQRHFFQQTLPDLLPRILWLDSLPSQPFSGVILANEVLDAMPVHRFKMTSEKNIEEFYVGLDDDQFVWQLQKPSVVLDKSVKELAIDFSSEYESEINLFLPAWLQSLSQILEQGLVLVIDYGFPRSEYYLAERAMGTLMCHFQHQAHANPFLYPGIQDITAHVDFSAVAYAADAAGFAVRGYTNQANFLLSCGITEKIFPYLNTDKELAICNQVKVLTLPQQMGELFKCMALTKQLDLDLVGFNHRDLRDYL